MGSPHPSSTAYIRGIGACLQLSIAVDAFLNTALYFVLLVIFLICLDVTCCVHLLACCYVLLEVVSQSLKPVKLRANSRS